ncbi:M56 family metallopeptidase [Nocardiopsis sp. RSe5-2]|uniref:M56 family metallopeptidase n=1 Tax=Nocardiopsis endophytica TaxID=3018445 RepID=A0ABT4U911_9ACTN|nr:M56 family metallopeptidase [Nocardiopsis endophytica]MDA2813436.1 M56 family metallopeptidase [Nocardiopsis endophytica]
MTWYTLAPALLLVVPALALARLPLPIHPAWSARLLAVLAVSAALTAVSTAGLLGGAFLAGVLPPDTVSGPERGRLLLEHGPVPAPVGVLALALLAVGAVGTALLALRWWRGMREVRRHGDGAGVVADDRPMAMAVPGRRGGVMLSRGLLRMLGRDQLSVVLRHEHAHLRHRHHVYAAAGALAAALFPPLAPVHRRLRFDLERWADEEAAAAVGDRGLVARTIAQVSLAAPGPGPSWHPGLADYQVVRRVEALLDEPPSANPVAGPALLGGTGVASGGVASTCVELHHLAFLLLL